MRRRLLTAGLGALLLLGAGRPAGAGDPLEKVFGGAFTLVNQEGSAVSDAEFRGRYLLLAFGYTHCPDVCPTDLMAMTQALDALGPAGERVTPAFATVDPERDTPPVLREYLSSFHPRFVGLTGSEAQVAAAAKAFKVHRRKVLPSPGATEDYFVDHGSLIYLIGPDGRFLTLFPAGTPGDRTA
ncbi:SCO family protein, partial [Nostoc sp. NIES-2111]